MVSSLASDCGISPATATIIDFDSVIELCDSPALDPMRPIGEKALVKTPKLYFYDSGLRATFLNRRCR